MEMFRLPTTAGQIAGFIQASIVGEESREVDALRSVSEAGSGSLTYISNRRYARQLKNLGGAVVLSPQEFVTEDSPNTFLVVDNPEQAFAQVARQFEPLSCWSGISPLAYLDPTATLEEDVVVGPYAVVGPGVKIGRGTQIFPHAVIQPQVRVGRDCEIHSQVVLYQGVVLGDRVRVLAGAVVGSAGFGLYTNADGKQEEMPQLGSVEVGDDVRIGAHCTVDRGTLGPTRIGSRTKLDDQVHVAHNVSIDEDCVICAQVGIAGSVTIEKNVMLGGQVGLRDGIRVGEGARLGGQSGAVTNVPGGETYTLTPLVPASQVTRIVRVFRRLPELWNRVRALEERVGADAQE